MMKYPQNYQAMTQEEMTYVTGGALDTPVPIIGLCVGLAGMAVTCIGAFGAEKKLRAKIQEEHPEFTDKELEDETWNQFKQSGSYIGMSIGASLSTICIIVAVLNMIIPTQTVNVTLPEFNPPVTPPKV